MGFPSVRCKKALLATGNGNDADAAMEWLFAHMDDPGEHGTTIPLASHTNGQLDIDDPIPSGGTSHKSAYVPSEEQVAMLAEMGFTSAQARKALRETVRFFV
jgi:ubiquitin carboxyl-terminal hydrolase 5/13